MDNPVHLNLFRNIILTSNTFVNWCLIFVQLISPFYKTEIIFNFIWLKYQSDISSISCESNIMHQIVS